MSVNFETQIIAHCCSANIVNNNFNMASLLTLALYNVP